VIALINSSFELLDLIELFSQNFILLKSSFMQNVIEEATPAHSTINDNPRVASIRAN